MGIYVYVTDRCRKDAQTHTLQPELARVRQQVEAQQSVSFFDRFPYPYLVKKQLGGRNRRLLAQEFAVGEHRVLVLLAILIRGGAEYQRFAQDPVGFGQQQFGELIAQLDLPAYLAERTQTEPLASLPKPSAAEYDVLYSAFGHWRDAGQDELVYDAGPWVDRTRQELVSNQLNRVHAACWRALEASGGVSGQVVAERPDWRVWFWRGPGHLVLLDVTTSGDAAPSWIAGSPFGTAGEWSQEHQRCCRRAYPSLLLYDEDLWIEVQKEPLGNMALSPEETKVLEGIRGSGSGAFPLFINGRAGSGKSTLLQYLFADLLFYHLSKDDPERLQVPLYLTASLDLLETAKGLVERLLRSEAALRVLGETHDPGERQAVVQQAFQPFRRFALSLLPADLLPRFGGDGYVSYATFRRLWQERYNHVPEARTRYGADLCWHVIRSYIKGLNAEDYLEPDDYRLLPEQRKSVSAEDFALVHERVWRSWYQPLTDQGGCWDDQDLARCILANDLAQPVYPAVVCDEAQDFTSIELELILRCNLFSARVLSPHQIPRVPFAFAGDPFQTLNPTGFRWDAVKAAFHERFIDELNRAGDAPALGLNCCELEYNYRSSGPIVHLGNWVQALRVALLDDPDARPQRPWSDDQAAALVVWYSADDPQFWRAFEEQSELVVIVPCGEGEEADYVANDPLLSRHIGIENGVPLRVLSAARAKGCEYPAVLVYGFGSESPVDVLAALETEGVAAAGAPQLPLQYFLNRLYVAVSRAKRRLVVVDSGRGLERLWAVSQRVRVDQQILRRIGHAADRWESSMACLTAGLPDQLGGDVAGDPQENARSFESEGDQRQDSYLLRQAAALYRRAGNELKHLECDAKALEYDGKYLAAAPVYQQARHDGEAIRCYWLAGPEGWPILAAQGYPPHLPYPDERRWAHTVAVGASDQAATALVEALAARAAQGLTPDESIWYRTWSQALAAILDGRATVGQIADRSLVRRLAGAFDQLAAGRLKLPDGAAGAVYYDAERYRQAVRHWDRLPARDRPEAYQIAQAQLADYPASLLAWQRCKRPDQMLQVYREHLQLALGVTEAVPVLEALLAEGTQLGQAYRLAWNTTGSSLLLILLQHLVERGRPEAAGVLEALVYRLVEVGDFDRLQAVTRPRGSFAPATDFERGSLATWIAEQRLCIQSALIRALARSERFAEMDSARQQEFGAYLNEHLRVTEWERWARHVTIPEAGAAIERAGKFTDSLSFYAAVLRDDNLVDHHRLARERMWQTKRRQVEYEKRPGSDPGRLQRAERELRQLDAEFSPREREAIPTYPALPRLANPSLPTLDPAPLAAAASPFESSPVDPQWLPDRRRLNLRHSETGDTISVRLAERICQADVELAVVGPLRWDCAEWGLRIELLETAEQVFGVAVTISDQRAEFRLPEADPRTAAGAS
ncbi:MAG: hypothetical protein IT204_11650 [Fimbriimonadaceae bacterium]|nr:hypothetical protein [Fimbriimonadaceae bacterium]